MKAAGERHLWDKYQEEKQQGKDETAAKHQAAKKQDEDVEMQVDWHEFVVVEKIDLYDDEEMKMILEEEEAEEARRRQEEHQRNMIRMQIQENEQLIHMPEVVIQSAESQPV